MSPRFIPAPAPRTSKQKSTIAPCLVAAALGLASPAASRQVGPQGPEFQVNSYTTSAQGSPAVAFDGQGNFVFTWVSDGSSGTDTSSQSVQAQRYDIDGAPLGGQFQVNTYTTDYQGHAKVAANGQGNFIIVWRSNGSSGTDTSGASIQARFYDANGDPLGGQIQVNSFTTNEQRAPAAAANGFGEFVVAWHSYGSSGTDTSSYSIQAQRYDANGAPLGGQFQVNTYTTNEQKRPVVGADGQGNFVVAWESFGSSGTDTSAQSIQAQLYDVNGAPLGGQFQVNTYTINFQESPAVAVDGQGNFVVAWDSFGSNGTDTGPFSIQAQRYDANGVPSGGQFQVNTYTTSLQLRATVAADGQGDFVVAWESNGSSGTDTSNYSIQAQRYAANGAPLGGQFQVNTYTSSSQGYPAVSANGSGDFVVTWRSIGSSGTDSSITSIQAQRYGALFRDGFESNDTSRWSATVP